MPYRIPAVLPPARSLVVHPRRTPTTGVLALAGSVFTYAAASATIRALDAENQELGRYIHATLLLLGAMVAGYVAWQGIRGWLERMHVSVSATDDVTLSRSTWGSLGTWGSAPNPDKTQSFPLAAVRDVRVVMHARGTSRVMIELLPPRAAIALDVFATVDDLAPLAERLRSFLLSG